MKKEKRQPQGDFLVPEALTDCPIALHGKDKSEFKSFLIEWAGLVHQKPGIELCL